MAAVPVLAARQYQSSVVEYGITVLYLLLTSIYILDIRYFLLRLRNGWLQTGLFVSVCKSVTATA